MYGALARAGNHRAVRAAFHGRGDAVDDESSRMETGERRVEEVP